MGQDPNLLLLPSRKLRLLQIPELKIVQKQSVQIEALQMEIIGKSSQYI